MSVNVGHRVPAALCRGALVWLVLLFATLPHAGGSTSTAAAPRAPAPAGSIASLLAGLREVNYYPARDNWSNMWTVWDPGAIDADFARIAALHANTVRVILQAQTIGYPEPQPVMRVHLAQIVALAQTHGLRVQLTLFDHWDSYADVAGSERWAHAVLAPYARDPRIAFIELRNEIDPTDRTAIAWARQLLPYVRAVSGGTPVTLSVSNHYGIGGLRTLLAAIRPATLDFAEYHYYAAPQLAYTAFREVQQAVAPLPLFIGETGFSTAPSNKGAVSGLGTSGQALDAYQDYYYRVVQLSASALGLPPVAPWTLTDFAAGSIQGARTASPEYGFGLFQADGAAKPIVASVIREFTQGLVDTSFNQGFESCAYGAPYIWQRFDQGEADFSCDTHVSHSGHVSARISHSRGNADGVPAFFVSPPVVGLTPGVVYTATAWVRGQNLTGTTRIGLAWFDARSHYLSTTTSPALPAGTTGWTLLTARGVAPSGAAYVQIHLESAYNDGAAWFDDVTFRPLEG